jgi:hypothetical protein
LKMSDYRLDSKAPMPFGAPLSTGWDSIRVTIGGASAQLPKQKCLLVDGGECTGSPLLHESSAPDCIRFNAPRLRLRRLRNPFWGVVAAATWRARPRDCELFSQLGCRNGVFSTNRFSTRWSCTRRGAIIARYAIIGECFRKLWSASISSTTETFGHVSMNW